MHAASRDVWRGIKAISEEWSEERSKELQHALRNYLQNYTWNVEGIPELDRKRRLSYLLSAGNYEARQLVKELAPDAIRNVDNYDRSCGR